MNLSFDDIELEVLDEQFSDAGGDMAGSIVGGIGSLGSIFGEVGKVKKYNKALNDRHAFYEKSKRLIDAKVIQERQAMALLKDLNLSKRLKKAKTKGSKKKKTGLIVGATIGGVILILTVFLLIKKRKKGG